MVDKVLSQFKSGKKESRWDLKDCKDDVDPETCESTNQGNGCRDIKTCQPYAKAKGNNIAVEGYDDMEGEE